MNSQETEERINTVSLVHRLSALDKKIHEDVYEFNSIIEELKRRYNIGEDPNLIEKYFEGLEQVKEIRDYVTNKEEPRCKKLGQPSIPKR